MGRTRTNRLTFVEIPKNINFNFSLGDEIDVRINEARPFSLTGELYLWFFSKWSEVRKNVLG